MGTRPGTSPPAWSAPSALIQRRVQLRSTVRLHLPQHALTARDARAVSRNQRMGAATPDQPLRTLAEREQPEAIARAQGPEQQAAGARGRGHLGALHRAGAIENEDHVPRPDLPRSGGGAHREDPVALT